MFFKYLASMKDSTVEMHDSFGMKFWVDFFDKGHAVCDVINFAQAKLSHINKKNKKQYMLMSSSK